MAQVTIKDIAKKAGVSPMAVSLALRNLPGVSEQTRAKVTKVAETMGYRRSPYVSALMSKIREGKEMKDRPVIAFINFHEGNPRLATGLYLPHAQARCDQLGFQMEMFRGNDPKISAARLGQILHARGVQGVVVGPATGMRGEFAFPWQYFSSALIGYSLQQVALHRAVNHQSHTVRCALEAMRERGYRRVGLITNSRDDRRVDFNWVAGWAAFHNKHGMKSAAPVLMVEPEAEDGPERIRAWVQRHRLDGILGGRHGYLAHVRGSGLRVPEDVGFACCQVRPEDSEVSGVDQNTAQTARNAVNLVVEQLMHHEVGIPPQAKTVMVDGNWFQGSTTPPVGQKSSGPQV